jgi:hypothetical protein
MPRRSRKPLASSGSLGQLPPTYTMPITVTPSLRRRRDSRCRRGISCRHGGQSWFQKFTTTILPA